MPKPLVGQWRDELRRRFLLASEMERNTVRVLPMDDRQGIDRELNNAGMLVVDEAHYLSNDEELYNLISHKSRTIPRVLLLSATPVLRNEHSFLGMLHILDPAVFSLTKEESFRHKITHRQALAEIVAGLLPENSLQLEDLLDSLIDRFPDDELLLSYVTTLRKVLEGVPDQNDVELLEAISRLRYHLTETYRLDRRILGNRRAGVPGLTPDRLAFRSIDQREFLKRKILLYCFDFWRIHRTGFWFAVAPMRRA